MSDPVTQVEIEDVLTSIRRLVSGNGAAPMAAAVPQSVPDEPPDDEAADRLVLTPALRVSEVKDDEPSGQEGNTQSNDFDSEIISLASDHSEDDKVDHGEDSSETFVEDAADYPQNTHFDDVAEDVSDAEVWETFEDLEPRGDLPDSDEVERILETADDLAEEFDEDEGIALSDAQAVDSRIVQWGRIGIADEPPYEPDVPGDSDYAGTDVSTSSWAVQTPVGDEAIESHEDEVSLNDTQVEFEPEIAETSVNDVVDTDNVEDIWQENAEASFEDASTTDDAGQDDEAEDAIPMFIPGAFRRATEETQVDDAVIVDDIAAAPVEGFEDQAAPEANDYFEETFEAAIAPEMDGFDPDDTAFLDEAMMRDLVGEIVRQELQGALGERITRNVRKLVRREIHRALAAHELE